MKYTTVSVISCFVLIVNSMLVSWGQAPQLVAKRVDENLAAINAPGWNTLLGIAVQTSGNPTLGGHGGVMGRTPALNLKAAHDGQRIYFRLEWADNTKDQVHNVWTYKGGAWSSGGNEDRIYVSFPTVDVPGRGGKTFAEAGCAMMCHQRDTINRNAPVINTSSAFDDCTVCHANAAGNVAGRMPLFEHPVPVTGECAICHEGIDNSVIREGGADMIVPSGGAIDIWHWKSGRSAPLGLAEDQGSNNGSRRTRDGVDLAPLGNDAVGKPLYVWVNGTQSIAKLDPLFKSQLDAVLVLGQIAKWDETSGNYLLLDGTAVKLTEGTTIRRTILDDVTKDGSSDVKADSLHDGSKWTVVLSRTLTTLESTGGSTAKDYDFRFGPENYMAIAVTDNSGIDHRGSGLIQLIVEGGVTTSIDDWDILQ